MVHDAGGLRPISVRLAPAQHQRASEAPRPLCVVAYDGLRRLVKKRAVAHRKTDEVGGGTPTTLRTAVVLIGSCPDSVVAPRGVVVRVAGLPCGWDRMPGLVRLELRGAWSG